MKLTQLFGDADDFCSDFHSSLARKTADERRQEVQPRAHRMSYREMMTLLTINRGIGPSSGFNNSTFVSTGYPRFPVY